jgi:ribose transport system ATP-binding protein
MVLELTQLSKTFPGQRALDHVDLFVARGQVHALVGHNGSGKSTLIKVLSGYHSPDPGGRLVVDGTEIELGDGHAAHRAGFRFVHQDLGLVDELTVLENLRLRRSGYSTGLGWRIRWNAERAVAARQLDVLGLSHLDPEDQVGRLSAIERTEVAVTRALQDLDGVQVVVFDEPTASLPDQQVAHLFALIGRLTDRGIGVIYVSHRLEEVFDHADVVTVLRDGMVVTNQLVASLTHGQLAQLIAGSGVDAPTNAQLLDVAPGPPLLSFDTVHDGHDLHGLSFTIHAGEVVGVAGLVGSGVHDLPQVLLGDDPVESGVVTLPNGSTTLGAAACVTAGVAVVPARSERKLIDGMSMRENLTLANLGPYWRRGVFSERAERRSALGLMETFGITPLDTERSIEKFSGGNRQKAFLARWLHTRKRVLVLEEPTQGVDVGGSAEILRTIIDAAAGGDVAVLICSSDLDDLADVCTRILILRSGQVAAELPGAEATRATIVAECYSATERATV